MLDMLDMLAWIGSIGSIISNILVARKQVLGAKIWTFATFILFLVACIEKGWSQVFLFGIYEIINIYMWYNWSKNK